MLQLASRDVVADWLIRCFPVGADEIFPVKCDKLKICVAPVDCLFLF
jgi:hypothetical protein